MKKFLLKTLDVILTIIMVVSVIYAVFSVVMSFLPTYIQEKVFDWLHMSKDYITTFSISATINAVILITSRILQINSRIKLNAKLSESEKVINDSIAVNDKVVEKSNEIINSLNVTTKLLGALISVQEVTTNRNIKASERLVYKDEKEAYSKALVELEAAKEQLKELDNISKVYEKTEIKEVVVEKEVDGLSGRV